MIEIDLFELIRLNPVEAIEINLNKKLKLDLHLLKSKLHNNIEFLNQTMLYVLNFNTQILTPIFDILFEFKIDTITFILFNQLLTQIETV